MIEFDKKNIIKKIREIYSSKRFAQPEEIFIFDSPLECVIAYKLLTHLEQQKFSKSFESIINSLYTNYMDNILGHTIPMHIIANFNFLVTDDNYKPVLELISDNKFNIKKNAILNTKKISFKFFIIKHSSCIITRKYCIISKPPTFINVDEKDRLHSSYDYSIFFKDGYGLHFLNGIFIPKDIFSKVKNDTMTVQEIFQLTNLEQKSAIIQTLGYQKIISQLKNYKILDTYQTISKQNNKPLKYEVIEFYIDDNIYNIQTPVRFVKVQCHTEHKITTLGVPIINQTETCMGAIAWTFGLKIEEYKPSNES